MAIITISRGSFVGGHELSQRLAEQLGLTCVTREELVARAVADGVPVEQLEKAVARPSYTYTDMDRDRDLYLASITSQLTSKILEGSVIYEGHTGHMLLCGVPNILRIMVLAEPEFRVASVMRRLGLSREKARAHIVQVDADRDRWVKYLYGVDWRDPANYDVVIHLDQMGLNNATSVLCAMARLPEFVHTPGVDRSVASIHLGSKARFALLSDSRTSRDGISASGDDGVVQVICPPRHAEIIGHVRDVLSQVDGVREVYTTIADTRILVLQETFDCRARRFGELIRAAEKLDAAVELMRYDPRMAPHKPEDTLPQDPELTDVEELEARVHPPVTDLGSDIDSATFNILDECLSDLRQHHRSAGSALFCGDTRMLATRLRRGGYSMVILGDLFLNRSESARQRMRDELKSLLVERTGVPVVDASELERRLSFGGRQAGRLVLSLLISAALFGAVFMNQERMLTFLTNDSSNLWRSAAVAFVALLTPVFAYAYGTFTGHLLELFNLD
ncbi:MAG: cytidylate kinase-like family protein [candidate division Zixibacteria bacterium]|nr:cytidylate kinase-like family protein [candidate division Zixibacteria bacterium]